MSPKLFTIAFAFLQMLVSVPMLAQISIEEKPLSKTVLVNAKTPDYSLKYNTTVTYSPWENMSSGWYWTDNSFNYSYLKGEKIFVIDSDIRPLIYIDWGNCSLANNKGIPPMEYYTVGEYIVCKEQIDSLLNRMKSLGMVFKNMVECPEEVSTLSFKKQREYEKKKAFYESLPSLPSMFLEAPNSMRPWPTVEAYNSGNTNGGAFVELIDKDGNSFFFKPSDSRQITFYPISEWNALSELIVGQQLYMPEAVPYHYHDVGADARKKIFERFSSYSADFKGKSIQLRKDNPEDIKFTFEKKDGSIVSGSIEKKYRPGGTKDINGRQVNLLTHVFREDGIASYSDGVVILTLQEYDDLKNNIQFLCEQDLAKETKRDADRARELKEYQAQKEERLKGLIKKYGTYYGELINQGKIAHGMTEQMCYDALGRPSNVRKTTVNGGDVVELEYYRGPINSIYIELTNGKVTLVSEENIH